MSSGAWEQRESLACILDATPPSSTRRALPTSQLGEEEEESVAFQMHAGHLESSSLSSSSSESSSWSACLLFVSFVIRGGGGEGTAFFLYYWVWVGPKDKFHTKYQPPPPPTLNSLVSCTLEVILPATVIRFLSLSLSLDPLVALQ